VRALVSVHDKTGLVPFVSRLQAAGWEIVSSGGTAASLDDAGVAVIRVSDVTGSPEILDGRVKTLHPAIHGGILARGPEDEAELAKVGATRFDLVVCNLYPFRRTLESGAGEARVVEMIDIGGPAMIRAAAKNHERVAVVVDPGRYDEVADAIEGEGIGLELRRELAAEAFFHTAAYDAAIAEWLGGDRVVPLRRVSGLRYGENPHQPAALYLEDGESPWWAKAEQVQGKEMSFNNYADAEAAWRLCADLGRDSAVVIKHTVACGAASAGSVAESFRLAWDGDPQAAFGGVVGINGEIDAPTAEEIASRFVEVVVARSLGHGAAAALSRRAGMRVLIAPAPEVSTDYRRIAGGFLVQEPDTIRFDDWETVSERGPTAAEKEALRVAWTVAAHARSNAVVLVDGVSAVGVGSGDQSRVGAAERAVAKAGTRARGAVAASDAFFPFRDGIDTLAAAGVIAVVAPGGSRNDAEVVAAADEHGMALLFSPERHFRH
jgi:phosphoribosylaminoimidazolecarboxamide formyltransferase / IMP cyclohydrolase